MLIFGYGSLVNVQHLQAYLGRSLSPGKDFRFCQLQNYRRCWTVAMDNRINVPGYKYYVEKNKVEKGNIKTANGDCQGNRNIKLQRQGEAKRLNGFVTFLNIRPCSGNNVTGIVFEVSNRELVRLDQRERNYRKANVTATLDDVPISEPVYAYIGLAEAEKRYQQGLKQNSAMISQDYYDLVYRAYESLGPEALADYLDTTDMPTIPIVALEKRQVSIY